MKKTTTPDKKPPLRLGDDPDLDARVLAALLDLNRDELLEAAAAVGLRWDDKKQQWVEK